MDSDLDKLDLREFIEAFRKTLANPSQGAEGVVGEQLLRYEQFCERANQRLRECFTLVKRGQVANAVAMADRDPNLLEWCTLLDIPESNILPTVAEVAKVKPPMQLNRELVEALQSAYLKGSTVAGNLRLLHRLTLARAPLPTRLAVMRRLYLQDPNHPSLDSDIRTFEKAWYKQAPDFVKPLVRQGRPELVDEILLDLSEGGYLESPPPGLVSQLQGAATRAWGALLPQLATEIRKAHAEQAIIVLAQLAERWRVALGRTNEPNANAKHGVVEALGWLDAVHENQARMAQREAATARLLGLLADKGASKADLESAYLNAKSLGAMDDDLARRYQFAMDSLDRRKKNMFIGVGAGVLVLVIAVAAVVFKPAGGEATTAGSETLANNTTSPPTETTSPADANTSDDPKKAVREFEQQTTSLKAAASSLLADAEKGGFDDALTRKLDELDARRKELLAQTSGTPQGEAQLSAIEKSLKDARSWVELNGAFAALRKEMNGIRASQQTLDRFGRFLKENVATTAVLPDLAEKARQGAEQVPAWKKVLELQERLESGKFRAAPLDAAEWKQLPPAKLIAAANDYGAMLKNRDQTTDGSDAAKFKERLTRRDVADLWVVRRTGEEEQFYTKEPPPESSKMEKVNVLLGSDGRTESIPFESKRQVDRAPQSEFAKKAEQILARSESDGWVETLASLDESLADSKKMDPLLKLDLVRRLLNLASATSAGYHDLLEQNPAFKEVTGVSALLEGNWLDPGQNLEAQRAKAREFLSRAPRLKPLESKATERDKARYSELQKGVTIPGWLYRELGGGLVLAELEGGATKSAGDLYVITKDRWIVVGKSLTDGGKPQLNETAADHLGWPVFSLTELR